MIIIFNIKKSFKKSEKLRPVFYDCTINIFCSIYFQRTILIIFFGTMITFFGLFPCNCSFVLSSAKTIS